MQTRNTRQRRLILAAVRARTDHPSANEIYLDVKKKDSKISRGTVYRNLNLLAQSRKITQIKVPIADRYDLRRDFHYHLLCISCNGVFDAPICYQVDYDKMVEEETGFQICCHRTVFEGLCPDCRTRMASEEEGNE